MSDMNTRNSCYDIFRCNTVWIIWKVNVTHSKTIREKSWGAESFEVCGNPAELIYERQGTTCLVIKSGSESVLYSGLS